MLFFGKKIGKDFLVFSAILTAVVFRYFWSCPVFKIGDTILIKGKVLSEPVSYDFSQKISLSGLVFYLPKYPEVGYRDNLVVSGKVVKAKKGKGFVLENPKLVSLEQNQGVLLLFRSKIISFYRRSLPEPHSSLIAGVTLGSKSSIPEEFWNHLKLSGTAHVVVASGTNVTLVAGFIMSLLLIYLPRRKAAVLSILVVWIYAILAGFDAPIVRAAIMGSLLFISQIFGKVGAGIRILVISALTMLLVKPVWVEDLGFWMSFTATASLMLFGKTVERVFKRVPAPFREGLSTSFTAQVGVAPILYYAFGYVSIYSPLVNMLILWVVPYITIVGLASGLIGVVYEPLGRLLLYLIYPLTAWFVWVVSLF